MTKALAIVTIWLSGASVSAALWAPTTWDEQRDGFVSVASILGSDASQLLLPRAASVMTTLRFLAAHEPYMVRGFAEILREVCAAPGGAGTFVDSGSNEGFFSLLAASHGCRAVAIDPQPRCVEMLRAAAARNGGAVVRNLEVYNALLAASPTSSLLPLDTCFGDAQLPPNGNLVSSVTPHVGRVMQKQYQRAEAAQLKKPRVNVSSIALDALVAGDVQLWHIDVEGAELPVLRSAARLLQQRHVQRVVLEVIPSAWAKFGVPDLERGLAELAHTFRHHRCCLACDGTPYHWDLWPATPRSKNATQCVDVACTLKMLDKHDARPLFDPFCGNVKR